MSRAYPPDHTAVQLFAAAAISEGRNCPITLDQKMPIADEYNRTDELSA